MLTYFGFMHGEAVGIGGGLGVTPSVALAYAVVAAGLYALSRSEAGAHYVAHPDMPLAANPRASITAPVSARQSQVR